MCGCHMFTHFYVHIRLDEELHNRSTDIDNQQECFYMVLRKQVACLSLRLWCKWRTTITSSRLVYNYTQTIQIILLYAAVARSYTFKPAVAERY